MTRVKVTFLGPYSVTFTVTFYVASAIVDPSDALIVAIITAIETLCACTGIRIEMSKATTEVSTPGSGILVAEDKLQVSVTDIDDNRHTFKVPAPAITGAENPFKTDNLTFDPASTSGAALSAAIETYARSQAGGVLTAIIEGHRTEGKHLKN